MLKKTSQIASYTRWNPLGVVARLGFLLLLLAAFALAPGALLAQSSDTSRGWLWNTSFYGYTYPERTLPPDASGFSEGTVRSQSWLLSNSFGYRVNRYAAFFADLPVYFVHVCRTDSAGARTCGNNNGQGDLGFSGQFDLGAEVVHFTSVATVRVPTGDEQKGLGAGAVTGAWSNTLSAHLAGFSPFVNVTLANSLSETGSFQRPFRSRGFITELSGGLEQRVIPKFHVGGSVYRVFPSGEQTTFGRFRLLGLPVGGLGLDRRRLPILGETTGTADLTRDYGGSLWARVPIHRNVQFQVAYTRSVHHNFHVISYGVWLNFSPLLRR